MLAHSYVDPLSSEFFEHFEAAEIAPVPARGAAVFSSITPPNRPEYHLQRAPGVALLLVTAGFAEYHLQRAPEWAASKTSPLSMNTGSAKAVKRKAWTVLIDKCQRSRRVSTGRETYRRQGGSSGG